MDWKDALLNLNLPEGDDTPQPAPDESTHVPAADQLLVELDRKGRHGKEATIISGFTIPGPEVAKIASQLKSRLATGGSSRGGEILIQGDRRDQVKAILVELGYKPKVR